MVAAQYSMLEYDRERQMKAFEERPAGGLEIGARIGGSRARLQTCGFAHAWRGQGVYNTVTCSD